MPEGEYSRVLVVGSSILAMKFLLESFTTSGHYYDVDKNLHTCSCQAFTNAKHCKHLEAVGVYKQHHAKLSPQPDYSQALSALVKSIRIRNVSEGAYWLHYCWQFEEKRFLTVLRLLIGSAEDGHSIAVMEKMSDNFQILVGQQVDFDNVLAAFLGICKVPNWWNPTTGGHDYIHCGMLAFRRTFYDLQPHTLDECFMGLESAIENQNKVNSLFWTMMAHETKPDAGLLVAQKLHVLAAQHDCQPAFRLMRNIYLMHPETLRTDSNFTCQAAWLLAGGESPVIDQSESVNRDEVFQILENVRNTAPYVVPEWGCDGVHCAGNDIRFAGMWDRMYAMCKQYNYYQRFLLSDEWLEDQFYSMDGLSYKLPCIEK